MIAATVLIAEVSDKEPTAAAFVVGAGVCMVAALLIVRLKWAALIALPLATVFAAFCAAYIFEEVGDSQVGPAIIHELGYACVALVYVCGITPIAVALPLFSDASGWRDRDGSAPPLRYSPLPPWSSAP